MRHTDPADLTEHALDDQASPLTTRQTRHLLRCAACAGRLASFRRVVRAARSATASDVPLPPPGGVWEAVVAGVAADGADGRPEGAAARESAAGPAPPGSVRRSRRSHRAVVAAASAACLVLGAGAGGTATWWEMQQAAPSATAGPGEPLTPPRAGDARGEARIVQNGESRRVRVTVHGLPGTSGYYEVWLMDRTHRKLIPLGTLGGEGTSTLPLPRGVSTDAFPLLDVSAQPYDGGTAHSGDSVVRGPLPAAGQGR